MIGTLAWQMLANAGKEGADKSGLYEDGIARRQPEMNEMETGAGVRPPAVLQARGLIMVPRIADASTENRKFEWPRESTNRSVT